MGRIVKKPKQMRIKGMIKTKPLPEIPKLKITKATGEDFDLNDLL